MPPRPATETAPLRASPSPAPLQGTLRPPGDKSISQRALILGAVACGRTRIHGLLESEDVFATMGALRAMGAVMVREDGVWTICGQGSCGLHEPCGVLDLGNAGTAARLLAGLITGLPFSAVLSGDASLSARPMARIITPLTLMGASIRARRGNFLPLRIEGAHTPLPLSWRSPIPSAQVKSAILLAALAAPGVTTVTESHPSRDHSERMLRAFGARLTTKNEEGRACVSLHGQTTLKAAELFVPTDPSAAAFAAAAAAARPGGRITIQAMGVNPLRMGIFTTLEEMGARLSYTNRRRLCEESADVTVEAAERLDAVCVPAQRAPAMIDDYPALSVACACAHGASRLEGLSELRVKESDRFTGILSGLAACGVRCEDEGDAIVIHGNGAPPAGGAQIAARHDHRMAMAFLALGLVARAPVTVTGADSIATSFPDFAAAMNALGARIAPVAS